MVRWALDAIIGAGHCVACSWRLSERTKLQHIKIAIASNGIEATKTADIATRVPPANIRHKGNRPRINAQKRRCHLFGSLPASICTEADEASA